MNRKGFAITELIIMLVIALVLIFLSVPKITNIMQKSQEAQTRLKLSKMRDAVIVYYESNNQQYPVDDLSSLFPKYIEEIPTISFWSDMKGSDEVHTGNSETYIDNSGGWAYVNDKNDKNWGKVSINYTAKDSSGKAWNTY